VRQRIILFPQTTGDLNVARNSKSRRTPNDREFSGKFVVIDLRPDERIEFEQWRGTKSFDVAGTLPKLCEQSWKVSFSFSDHYSCYYGSVTGKGRNDDYEAVTFTTRHTDFSKLLALLVYVTDIMLADGRLSQTGNDNPYDW
jgi:hypothetical protein